MPLDKETKPNQLRIENSNKVIELNPTQITTSISKQPWMREIWVGESSTNNCIVGLWYPHKSVHQYRHPHMVCMCKRFYSEVINL